MICAYKYKVMPHFIFYPTLPPGEFLSLRGICFDEVLNNSKTWEKDKPLIESSELSRLHDLTDNDIITRQINCSQILERLLSKRVSQLDSSTRAGVELADAKFDFDRDFYGHEAFWTSGNSLAMRFMALIFAFLYYPYSLLIRLFACLERFNCLNCIVMCQRKKHQIIQCQNYLRILKREKPQPNQNMFDFHFYKLAIYTRFASLLTQIVLDILSGIFLLIVLHTQTTSVLRVLHWSGQGLQLERLQRQTEWLMGLPGGFKPNPNLAAFIGNAILDLIYIWNYATTAFIQLQRYILTKLACFGVIGSTIQVALVHDVLFVCSSHIFVLYTVVAWIYNYILRMLGTLINLFNGKKFNVMRNRVDSNAFSL